ncbi:hypothetical protein ACE7GA_26565 (plasmid) [Roseomonas sp. CCTCC AB2023176]|uniref:hypothetical protein n=1 Tax=Roseomonas sp. CCTCC AB2023176 TaxID=3342640 RepID=UPI0035E02E24
MLWGWLRGERGHCSMVSVPTVAEEDARRPTRERENLVGERTRIINRLKAALARLGIRGFDPARRRSRRDLGELRVPDGGAIPPNTLAEPHRDLTRLCFVEGQIAEVEADRDRRLQAADESGAGGTREVGRSLSRVIGLRTETADTLVHEALSGNLRDWRTVAPYTAHGIARR